MPEVLLDPQCFVRDADHYRLVEHDYFKVYQQCSTGSILTGDGARKVVDAVAGLAETLETTRLVVPGLLGSQIDEDWFRFHEQLIDAAAKRLPSMRRLATLALSAAATADEAQVEAIVEGGLSAGMSKASMSLLNRRVVISSRIRTGLRTC